MQGNAKVNRGALFGPLPTRGIWTALRLTRNQFLFILSLSVVLFLFVDGPLWAHLHDTHFGRIVINYGVIPLAVTAALILNGKAQVLRIVVASAVIAGIKLVATAALLVLVGIAH